MCWFLVWITWLFVRHQYLKLDHFWLPIFPISTSPGQNWQATIQQANLWVKNIFLAVGKMYLNMKCLTNLVVAKQVSKDALLKLFHVEQTILVIITGPFLMPHAWLKINQNLWDFATICRSYSDWGWQSDRQLPERWQSKKGLTFMQFFCVLEF